MYACIGTILDNFEILQYVNRNDPRMRREFRVAKELLSEIEAILEPLAAFQTVIQTSCKPFGYASLAMIFHLLQHYGFDLSNGIVPFDDEVSLEAPGPVSYSQKVFQIRESDGRKPRRIGDFSANGQDFFETLTRHLAFRINQRQNNRLYELVALFTDPFLKKFAKKILGLGNKKLNWYVKTSWRWSRIVLRLRRLLL